MADVGRMVTRLQVGSLMLPHRLIQGPLAGISCAPFRSLFSLYEEGQPAYTVTEMIPVKALLERQKSNTGLARRYLSRSPHEGRLCVQLSGSNPNELHRATAIITNSHHADLIDLNCGCPKPKIRRKGAGSALTEELTALRAAVKAMRSATDLPLTVKIRVAGSTELAADPEQNTDVIAHDLAVAAVIADSGADALIVHGRHHSDNYDVPANYTQIRRIVGAVDIPVIANGDVSDMPSLVACVEATGAAAVMVGRGSIGRPWLFQQLLTQIRSSRTVPNPEDISGCTTAVCIEGVIAVFRHHVIELGRLEGSAGALLQARRLLKWYFPWLSPAQLVLCFACDHLDELCELLRRISPAEVPADTAYGSAPNSVS